MASKSELAELREENRLLRVQVSELLHKLNTYLEVQGVSAATCAIMDGRQKTGQKLKAATHPKKASHVQQRVQTLNANIAASSHTAPSAGVPTATGIQQSRNTVTQEVPGDGWTECKQKKKKSEPKADPKPETEISFRLTLPPGDWGAETSQLIVPQAFCFYSVWGDDPLHNNEARSCL